MKYLLLAYMVLAGCGGSGGGSSAPATPPGPPVPPVVVVSQNGHVTFKSPHFTAEVDTSLEYRPAADTIVVSTVKFGTITIDSTRHFTRGGVQYVVNYTSGQLIIQEVVAATEGVSWSLVTVASNG